MRIEKLIESGRKLRRLSRALRVFYTDLFEGNSQEYFKLNQLHKMVRDGNF